MVLVLAVLLLAAVGLLAAALVTGQLALAWGSVGASVLTAVTLLLRRRRRDTRDAGAAPEDDGLEAADAGDSGAPGAGPDAPTSDSPSTPVTGQAAPAPPGRPGGPDAAGGATGPGVEDTDAADLPVIQEMADEVLVVDEHPRYHLVRCEWLGAAAAAKEFPAAERLPVREAGSGA